MAYTFEPATRGSAKPLIGIYSESGCGKTMSALLLARGFAGPQGRIGMIETESGRGEAYSNPKEYPELAGPNPKSNYDVLRLRDNFAPTEYGAALKVAESAKLDALIIDSASHEWEGPGGVLSMAAKNQEDGKKGVLVWQQPKIQHSREFMLRFMQTPIPLVILCMRAKYPMEQKKGSSDWQRSSVLEPKQSEDILFEMFVHGWVDQEHKFHLTKSTSKTLTPVFAEGKPITLETGRELAAWAKGDGTTTPIDAQSKPQTTGQPDGAHVVALKAAGDEAATRGTGPLRIWFTGLLKPEQVLMTEYKDKTLKPAAEAVDQRANQDF